MQYFRNLKRIGGGAFYTTNIERIIIPQGCLEIGPSAFRQTKLVNLHIPSSVTKIDKVAFGSIDTLERVTGAEGVTELVANVGAVFQNEPNLVEIPTFKSLVGELGQLAFATSVSTVEIPEGIEIVNGVPVLGDNPLLSTVIVRAKTPIDLQQVSWEEDTASPYFSNNGTEVEGPKRLIVSKYAPADMFKADEAPWDGLFADGFELVVWKISNATFSQRRWRFYIRKRAAIARPSSSFRM